MGTPAFDIPSHTMGSAEFAQLGTFAKLDYIRLAFIVEADNGNIEHNLRPQILFAHPRQRNVFRQQVDEIAAAIVRDKFNIAAWKGQYNDAFVIELKHQEGVGKLCAGWDAAPGMVRECPAKTQGGRVFAIVSGQHRFSAVLFLLLTGQGGVAQLPEAFPFYVLKDDTPEFILDWLLVHLNNQKTISSEAGVLVFLEQYKYVRNFLFVYAN